MRLDAVPESCGLVLKTTMFPNFAAYPLAHSGLSLDTRTHIK